MLALLNEGGLPDSTRTPAKLGQPVGMQPSKRFAALWGDMRATELEGRVRREVSVRTRMPSVCAPGVEQPISAVALRSKTQAGPPVNVVYMASRRSLVLSIGGVVARMFTVFENTAGIRSVWEKGFNVSFTALKAHYSWFPDNYSPFGMCSKIIHKVRRFKTGIV